MVTTSAEHLASSAFRREREQGWHELDTLLTQIEARGLRSLPASDLARLPVLYRAAVSSLSVARAISLDRSMLDYLERLVARAYVCVYSPRERVRGVLGAFLAGGFAAALRRSRWHLVLSAATLLLGAAVAWVLTAEDLSRFEYFIDAAMAQGRDPTASRSELRAPLYSTGEAGGEGLLTFMAFLFNHNAGIGIFTFALGFVAGVPVLLLLLMNGMVLGAMSALYHARDLGREWWAWVLPHGITELLAIVICGAAGLRVADGLIFPGRTGRLEAIARHGREGGMLVFGAVVMLLLAAVIEGILRQTMHDVGMRYVLAATSAVAWLAYFTLLGRRGSP